MQTQAIQHKNTNTAPGAKLVQKKAATPAPAPDAHEREAEDTSQRITADGAIARGSIDPSGAGKALQGLSHFTPSSATFGEPIPGSVEQELEKPGTPLTPEVKQDMERRFGHDFSRVRIHAGPAAADSARDIRANAYTHGSHIVFGQGRFAPATPDGKRLMAHELTHVIQQSAAQRPVIAREPTDDPDKNVSLGVLDSAIAGRGASEILGTTQWEVLKEFLRGLKGGLEAEPADQRQRINDKFKNEGFIDSAKYTAGFSWGILVGIGKSIKGLFEAVITLVELPYKIGGYLADTVPELAVKYGPRLTQLLLERDGIQEKVKKVLAKFLEDPRKSIDMIKGFMDAVGQLALAKVRALGHSAAEKTLAFLEEPWFEYGKDIGSVVGQILFEVILAVASDAIGNVIKEALLTVGRLGARVVTGAVEIFRTLGRYIGEVIEWISRAAGKASGEMGEAFESVRTLLTKLRTWLAELAEEGALADTGVGGIKVKVPDVKPNVLESRAVRPPGSPTVADLRTPKIHPSNLPKEPPVPKGGLAGEAESAAAKPARTSASDVTAKGQPGQGKQPAHLEGEGEARTPPKAADLKAPKNTSEAIDDLDQTANARGGQRPGENATIGSELERLELQTWRSELNSQGFGEVYGRKQFKSKWLGKVFTDGRSVPDMVAVDLKGKRLLVGDITSEFEAAHFEGTIDYGKQLARNLPEEFKDFEVFVQERFWKSDTLTKLVKIAK